MSKQNHSRMPRSMDISEFTGIAKKSGTGAHVFVPKEWIGYKVKLVRLEKVEETSDG